MGHVWDETLEEYNNPMPKWWSWLFVITVVFRLRLSGALSGAWQLQGRAGLDFGGAAQN
jgi:cytochrome c oxidase cbb3-type subunit 3